MKKKLVLTLLLIIFATSFINAALPPTIVYKTKGNYTNLVPIGLYEDNLKIRSYPGPSDVHYMGELAYPSELIQGYLLDNRGVGPNSAFLDVGYEEYSKFNEIPSHEEFLNMIKDYDPFLEMYDCGNRYESTTEEITKLNKIISEGKLNEDCKSLLTKSGELPVIKRQKFQTFVKWFLPISWFLILFIGIFFLFKYEKTKKKIDKILGWTFISIIILSLVYLIKVFFFTKLY